MDEFSLIERYFAPLAGEGAFGLKDDAALIAARPGFDLVVTTDAISEGTDFFAFDPAGGMKAVGHNGHARADASVLWDLDVTVVALGNDLSEPTPMTAMLIREFIVKQKAHF